MCFSTVSFIFTKDVASTLLTITSNLVTGFKVNEARQIESEDVTMNCVLIKGSRGGKSIVGFRQRDFYEINNAQQDVKIYLRDAIDGTKVEGAHVLIHVLLRRVR